MRIVPARAATAIDVSDDGSGFSRGTGTSIHVTDKIEIASRGRWPKARARKISAAAIFMTGGRQDMEHASELAARWAITVGGGLRSRNEAAPWSLPTVIAQRAGKL